MSHLRTSLAVDSTASASTIKIGAIVPFEGQSASLGKSFLEAVRVSMDNLGDTKNDYQLVVEDGGTTPEESERAAWRLVEEDGADAIVGGISKVGGWVAPIAKQAGMPQICICSIPSIGDGEYNFTNIRSPPTRPRPGLRRPSPAACGRSPFCARSTRASMPRSMA